jgi:hypothetical protein
MYLPTIEKRSLNLRALHFLQTVYKPVRGRNLYPYIGSGPQEVDKGLF